MSSILTTAFLGSAVVAGSVLGITLAQDSSRTKPCLGELCPPKSQLQDVPDQGKSQKKMNGGSQGEQMPGQDQPASAQGMPQKKKRLGAPQTDADGGRPAGVQAGGSRWRFDPDRHQRRRSRSAAFRFYFDGYWYPQPYWQIAVASRYRIGCGEGRAIVAQRFNRVRVIECRGRTYTYLGRRHGEAFRIRLDARSGRIVGRLPI